MDRSHIWRDAIYGVIYGQKSYTVSIYGTYMPHIWTIYGNHIWAIYGAYMPNIYEPYMNFRVVSYMGSIYTFFRGYLEMRHEYIG